MRSRGFTLVEVIISVVVLGIVMYSLVTIFISSGFKGVNVERYTIGQTLAENKLEEAMVQDYGDVSDEAETAFGGDLSGYTYEIAMAYVSGEALDTPVGTDQGYKRVRVSIRHAQLTSPVILESIKADY
ncbi:prepilin-type N-terminal cleavage/methylation domain-containing protein [Candidatus Margulisiibacteriota bacterium]